MDSRAKQQPESNVQTDTSPLTHGAASAELHSTASSALDHLIRHLGCAEAVPDTDGIYSLALDDQLTLALWPDSTQTFVILAADVPAPAEMDQAALHRAAMNFNLGAASSRAPILSLDAEGRLMLAWTVPSSLEQAEAGMDYFLENLGMASSFLAESALGESVGEAAGSAGPVSSAVNDAKTLIVSRIAQRLNADTLSLDSDGLCLLQTDDNKLIFVKTAPDESAVTLGAEVASLRDADAAVYSDALAYNFSAVTNNSASLALDDGNESLLLVTCLSASETNAERIEADLESFFRAYASCFGQLLNLEHFEDLNAEDEAESNEEASLDLLAGSIRI